MGVGHNGCGSAAAFSKWNSICLSCSCCPHAECNYIIILISATTKLWCVHTIKRSSKLILIVTPIMCKQLDDILHATNAPTLVPVHYTVCRACPSVFPCYSHYLLAQLVLHCLGVYYRYHSWARTTSQFKSSELMLAKPSHLAEEILASNLPDLNVSMWLTVTMISLLVWDKTNLFTNNCISHTKKLNNCCVSQINYSENAI